MCGSVGSVTVSESLLPRLVRKGKERDLEPPAGGVPDWLIGMGSRRGRVIEPVVMVKQGLPADRSAVEAGVHPDCIFF